MSGGVAVADWPVQAALPTLMHGAIKPAGDIEQSKSAATKTMRNKP